MIRFLFASLVALLYSAAAWADAPPGEAVAAALFEQAREDMRHGDFAAAYPKLVESERIDPANGTLFNLTLCEENIGKVASAWVHSKDLLDRLPAGDDRRPVVEQRIAALAGRLSTLDIRLSPTAPPDTSVLLDGIALGASSLRIALPVDPGVHHLTFTARGRLDHVVEISIQEGKRHDLFGEPGAPASPGESQVSQPNTAVSPAPGAGAVLSHRSASGEDTASSGSTALPKWLGWTATGVGVASLVAGVTMGALALDRKATVEEVCPAKQCRDQSGIDAANEGKKFVIGAVAGLAVGAAGVGFGVYVLTHKDSRGRAAPDTAFVTWAGSF